MPRMPRVYLENALYYITYKGTHNQKIFIDAKDYEMYFAMLKKYKAQHEVKVYAYNLMPNHLHLLLEVKNEENISGMMHNLTSAYTKYFNSRYQRSGHLFKSRYKAALVEKDPKVLLDLSLYIHLNPKVLNIAVSAREYPYGSYALYLDYAQANDRGLDIKEQVEFIIKALAGQSYADFTQKTEAGEELKSLHVLLQRRGALGSEEFMKRVKEQISRKQQAAEEPAVPAPSAGAVPAEPATAPQAGKEKKIFFGVPAAVLIVIFMAGGAYVYFHYSRPRLLPEQKQSPAQPAAPHAPEPAAPAPLLERDEWRIELVSPAGETIMEDTISFRNGVFFSSYLAKLQFSRAHYSKTNDGKKIIWETMQSAPAGTASWRGEMDEQGGMRGVLSLRLNEEKAPQDFTFVSMRWRRK